MGVRSAFALMCIAGLGGCASSVKSLDDLDLSQRAAFDAMETHEGPIDAPHRPVGQVKGFICSRNPYQLNTKTTNSALREMKIQAAALNADAVINTRCETRDRRDWKNNCLATISCTGDAVRLE